MTTYNHEKYIAEAIQSILEQTFEDFELIIVNDGSTDKTETIIKSFNDSRINYIYQENMGPSAAANTALRNAKGKYIALMSGDDVCYPNRLEVQYNEYIKSKGRLLFSWCDCINDNGVIDLENRVSNFFNALNKNKYENLRYLFFSGNRFHAITCFTEKKIFDLLGEYDTRLLQTQDFDMWLRALFAGYELTIIPQRLIKYRIRDNNQNLSAYRQDSAERTLFELKKIMKRYIFINDIDLFKNVFPEFREMEIDVIDIPLLLLRLSFEKNVRYMKYCLSEYFYEFLDKNKFTYYKKKFNFSMNEFYSYTGFGEIYAAHQEIDIIRQDLAVLQQQLDEIKSSDSYRLAIIIKKFLEKVGLLCVINFLRRWLQSDKKV